MFGRKVERKQQEYWKIVGKTLLTKLTNSGDKAGASGDVLK